MITQIDCYKITADILADAMGVKHNTPYIYKKMELLHSEKFNLNFILNFFDADTIKNLSLLLDR